MARLRYTDLVGPEVVAAWVEQANTLPLSTQRLFLTAIASNMTMAQARKEHGLSREQAMGLMARGVDGAQTAV